MNTREEAATTVDELVALTEDKSVRQIVVHGDLTDAPSIRLSPGQSLRGEDERSGVTFSDGTDGLQLSSDNRIQDIRLHVSAEKRAIFNDTGVESLGQIKLHGVTTTGRVQILAREKVRGGHVEVDGLDIVAAGCPG